MVNSKIKELLAQASTPGPQQQSAVMTLLKLYQASGAGGAPSPIPQQVSQSNLIQPNDTLPLIIGPSLDEDYTGTREARASAIDYTKSARNMALGQQQTNLDMQRIAKDNMVLDNVNRLRDYGGRLESERRARILADMELSKAQRQQQIDDKLQKALQTGGRQAYFQTMNTLDPERYDMYMSQIGSLNNSLLGKGNHLSKISPQEQQQALQKGLTQLGAIEAVLENGGASNPQMVQYYDKVLSSEIQKIDPSFPKNLNKETMSKLEARYHMLQSYREAASQFNTPVYKGKGPTGETMFADTPSGTNYAGGIGMTNAQRYIPGQGVVPPDLGNLGNEQIPDPRAEGVIGPQQQGIPPNVLGIQEAPVPAVPPGTVTRTLYDPAQGINTLSTIPQSSTAPPLGKQSSPVYKLYSEPENRSKIHQQYDPATGQFVDSQLPNGIRMKADGSGLEYMSKEDQIVEVNNKAGAAAADEFHTLIMNPDGTPNKEVLTDLYNYATQSAKILPGMPFSEDPRELSEPETDAGRLALNKLTDAVRARMIMENPRAAVDPKKLQSAVNSMLPAKGLIDTAHAVIERNIINPVLEKQTGENYSNAGFMEDPNTTLSRFDDLDQFFQRSTPSVGSQLREYYKQQNVDKNKKR